MYSHIARSESRSLLGFKQYRLTARIHLTALEIQIVERHRLRRIEIFYDPIRDELNANAERAHERAKARGLFVTRASDTSVICVSEMRALVSTIRALLAFNITVADLLRIKINQGQTNADSHFPNGRALIDDVTDTLLTVACNNGSKISDGVDANDKPFTTTFPFLASPHSGNP